MPYAIFFKKKGTKRWFRDKGMRYHTKKRADEDLKFDRKFDKKKGNKYDFKVKKVAR